VSADHEAVITAATTLDSGVLVDIGMVGDRIVAVEAAGTLSGSTMFDADGRLCIGAFVDAHCHLDKAYLEYEPECAGTYGDSFFAALRNRKKTVSFDEVTDRMRRAVHQVVLNGTGTMRAQIDVDDLVGTTHLKAALALRDEVSSLCDLQLVVFPQEGLVGNPAAREAVEEALELGADVMGGAHGFDRSVDNVDHLEACFELAVAYDVDLDLHVDFDTAPDQEWEAWDLYQVARLCSAHQWQKRVTVAHITQHGQMSASKRTEMVAMLVDHGIHAVVVPGAELHTARAWQTEAPATDVAKATADWPSLVASGLELSYAGGHLADAFNPYGEGDMLRDGLLMASARNLGDPLIEGCHVLTMGTVHPAHAIRGGGPYGVQIGAPADLVILDAPDADSALRRQADRWLVFHRGRPVARSRTERVITEATEQ